MLGERGRRLATLVGVRKLDLFFVFSQNITGTFFRFVTKYAYARQSDGRTDRITILNSALAELLRAVQSFNKHCSKQL